MQLCGVLSSTPFRAVGHPFTVATSNLFFVWVVYLAAVSAAMGRLEIRMFHDEVRIVHSYSPSAIVRFPVVRVDDGVTTPVSNLIQCFRFVWIIVDRNESQTICIERAILCS